MLEENEACCHGAGSISTTNSALNTAQNLQSYLEDSSNYASGFMADFEPESLNGKHGLSRSPDGMENSVKSSNLYPLGITPLSSALAFRSEKSSNKYPIGQANTEIVDASEQDKTNNTHCTSAYPWTLPSSHTASKEPKDFFIPTTEKRTSRPQRYKPKFLGQGSGPGSSNKEQVRIQSDVLDLSLDDFGTSSRKKSAPVSSVDTEESGRKNVLDPGTARKLKEFSLKLKELKAPATRKLGKCLFKISVSSKFTRMKEVIFIFFIITQILKLDLKNKPI